MNVGSVVIDCNDVGRMLAFWQAALRYVPREPPEDDWVLLQDPGGRRWRGCSRWERPPMPGPPEPGEDFVVLQDPEGNLFCVVDTRVE